jgi:hypothetical protein
VDPIQADFALGREVLHVTLYSNVFKEWYLNIREQKCTVIKLLVGSLALEGGIVYMFIHLLGEIGKFNAYLNK